MDSLNNKEFEDFGKTLERHFASFGLNDYPRIAYEEALTKLWEKEKFLGNELPASARKALLYTTTKNLIFDELRRQKKLRRIDVELQAFERILFEENFEKHALDTFAVQEAIEKLPQKQKEAVTLHRLAGYSVEETAERMEISVNTVKTHLKKALKKLYNILHDKK